MGLRFFHRFPIIGRFVTLNVSKTGVSASVGVPGVHVTHGTHGTRVTAGLPGTGLFYTEQIDLSSLGADGHRAQKLQVLFDAYLSAGRNVRSWSPDQIAAVVHQQKQLGLTDADLTPQLLEMRGALIEFLQAHGYTVVKTVAPARQTPRSSARAAWIPMAIVAAVIVVSIVAIVWLQ